MQDNTAGQQLGPGDASAADGQADRSETLDYLIALTVQLRHMAQRAGFDRLGLILMMAEQEGRQQLSSGDVSVQASKPAG